jgi:hypothetical protein
LQGSAAHWQQGGGLDGATQRTMRQLHEKGRLRRLNSRRNRTAPSLWYGLLILPFIATLVPGIYNRWTPRIFGMPFFYAYQLGWTVLSGLLLALFIVATRDNPDA